MLAKTMFLQPKNRSLQKSKIFVLSKAKPTKNKVFCGVKIEDFDSFRRPEHEMFEGSKNP
jgi:hypothetical protein